ncbi:MAG: hypothetical protein JNM18_19850, partial [Planctomycetaceae bacterium]|nr:hypothetical protein [Planctomycetaceae bacterium]
SNLAEASTSIAYCEVPDVYGGDFPNSGVSVILERFGAAGQAYGSTTDPGAAPGSEEMVAVVMPHLIDPGLNRRDTSLAGQQPLMGLDPWYTADPKIQQIIRPGDQIQFDLKGARYTLESSDNHPRKNISDQLKQRYGGPVWYVARALRSYDETGNYRIHPVSHYYVLDWFANGAPEANGKLPLDNAHYSLGSPQAGDPDFFKGLPVRYRIFRQPIKSADPPINLPEGAVIDLNFSGTKRLNFYPRLAPDYVQPGINLAADDRALGVPPNPYTGTAWVYENSPTTIHPAQFPNDQTPIIFTFSENGLIDRLFTRQWKPYYPRGTGEFGSWEWSVDRSFEPIYLLVGRREKVPAPVGANAFNNQVNTNWADSRNVWITINGQTGYVGSSQNAEVPFDVIVNGLKGHTKSVAGSEWWKDAYYKTRYPPSESTFQSMSSQARADGCLNGLNHMGYGARRIAMQQLLMGGK